MRVDWCVSSWFRIKNTHSLTHGIRLLSLRMLEPPARACAVNSRRGLYSPGRSDLACWLPLFLFPRGKREAAALTVPPAR